MKNSIVAGALARKFADSFKLDGRMNYEVQQGKFDLWIEGRACTIRGKPSGGIVLFATATGVPGLSVNFRKSKRIRKPRDLKAAIYRHAADLIETIRQDRSAFVWQLRSDIAFEVDRREFDIEKLPRPDQTIDDMPYEDCVFWLDWLKQQPIKQQSTARE